MKSECTGSTSKITARMLYFAQKAITAKSEFDLSRATLVFTTFTAAMNTIIIALKGRSTTSPPNAPIGTKTAQTPTGALFRSYSIFPHESFV
jgi:hypothetical protein